MAGDKIDEKVVFALGNDDSKTPVLILGVSQAAYEYCKTGKTHTFDLTKLGFPMKVILFGHETRQDCLDLIEQANMLNGHMKDITEKDMGIDEPKTH